NPTLTGPKSHDIFRCDQHHNIIAYKLQRVNTLFGVPVPQLERDRQSVRLELAIKFLGWLLQLNAGTLGMSNHWFPVPDSSASNRVQMTIDPAKPNVFYRMFRR